MSRLRTAYIRSQLLPSIIRGGVQKSMREYLDIRIQESTITPVDQAGRELLLAKASHSQAALWSYAQQVVEQVPNPVISFLFAVATIYGLDYLLTWNCKHIANAQIQKKLAQISFDAGYELPPVCTPYELMVI